MIQRTPAPLLSTQQPTWPKLCSADFQVRLKESQVRTLQWIHLDTSLHTAGLPANGGHGPLEGLTEWTATHQGRSLTLGWDWILCNDGQLRADSDIPPRANLLMLDPAGYDIDPGANARALQAIVTRIPWRREVSDWIGQQRTTAPLFSSPPYQI